MRFSELRDLVDGVEDFGPYGNTPLGVIAMEKGVINTKDNYARRDSKVRQWATEEFGDYAEGVYRAVNRQKPLNRGRQFERGYNHGRKLLG